MRVIVYTVDPPYSRAKPGFVAAQTGHGNPVEFTGDMWLAWAQDRASWERWLPSLRERTDKQLYTHEAFVAFVKP